MRIAQPHQQRHERVHRHPDREAVDPEPEQQRQRDRERRREVRPAPHRDRPRVAERAEVVVPVVGQVVDRRDQPEHRDDRHRRRPVRADAEVNEVAREQRDAHAERDPPQQRDPVGLDEALEQQVAPVAHGAHGGIHRRRQDLVDLVRVVGDLARERDVADAREAQDARAGQQVHLHVEEARQLPEEERPREAVVLAQRPAVVAQAQRVRRLRHADERRRPRAGDRPDHERPVAEPGDGERHHHDEPEHRVDRLQRALLGELHRAVVHPHRRLQHHRGAGDQRHERRRDDLPLPVGERDQRDRQRDDSGSGAELVDWVGTSMGGLLGIVAAAQPTSPVATTRRERRRTRHRARRTRAHPKLLRRQSRLRDVRRRSRATFARSPLPSARLTDAQWEHLTRTNVRRRADGRWRIAYDPGIAVPFPQRPPHRRIFGR